jgi:outer membrane protein assembly factor BamB
VQAAFTLHEVPAVIEGMTYDPKDKNFYFGESLTFRILRYSSGGRPAGYIDGAKDGITSILGMSVFLPLHHLWVCGSIQQAGRKTMCLFQYNLETGKLINRFPDTSGKALLFNDVAITADGSVYATDTYTRSLYKTDTVTKSAILYLQSDSLKDCNGITADGNVLFVSTSRGFARINTAEKSLTLTNLANFMIAGIDGLYLYQQSLIGIQNVFFPVTVARYFLDPDGKNITDARMIAVAHPSFDIPTTGAIVNDHFYFMANSNIGHFNPENKKLDSGKIKKVAVVKIPLARKSRRQVL